MNLKKFEASKKRQSLERKERLLWEKWRWEFMRRDPEFISDYKKIKHLREKAKYPPGSTEGSYLSTPEYNEEMKLRLKYDLRFMPFPDPEKSFEELIGGEPEFDKNKKNNKSTRKRTSLQRLFASGINQRAVGFWINGGTEENIKRANKVEIRIDFDKINSISALKKHVAYRIQEHYDWFYKKRLIDKKQRYKDVRDSRYELALMVGDFKDKQGLTNQDIAKKIDARKFKENPESAIRNISHYYGRYKNLVSGGWKEITYP